MKKKLIKQYTKKETKKKLLAVALVACACSASACSSGSMLSWQGKDYFRLEGTPEGIAAFDEYQNGLLTNGKMQDPKLSPHWTVKSKRIDYLTLIEQSKQNQQ